jgi:hypothetical protein
MIDDAVNYSTSVKSIKLNRGGIMNHHQLKRRDSVWLTSQQMTDLPTPTDEYNGWPDKIFQMLRYTIYRAISESDDAKGQKDAQSLVAGASNSSSSSSRSGSLTVRSHGVTTQIQVWSCYAASKSSVLLCLAWGRHRSEKAICVSISEEVNKIQDLESLVAGTGTKRVVNRPGHTMCDSDPQRCDELGLAT